MKKIAIRNFQSLQQVTVELGWVTVIVGHTDSGKSSLLRALEKACFNESSGDFITTLNGTQAEKAQVAIQFDEGVVVWERTKTTVAYRLIAGGNENRFTKIGRGNVPDEVRSLLGIAEIQVDTGNAGAFQRIQFAAQFDPPFLVGDRGGVASARVLGRLTGVHIFANASKRVYAASINLEQSIQKEEDEERRLVSELDQYVDLDIKQTKLLRLSSELAAVKVRQSRIDNLKRLLSLLKTVKAQLTGLRVDESKLQTIETLHPLWIDLWNRLAKLEKLKSAVSVLLSIRERLSNLPLVVDNIPDISSLETKLTNLESLKRALTRRKTTISDCDLLNKNETLINEDLSKLDVDLEQFNRQFPLCPFQDQFSTQTGVFRCNDLMQIIKQETK